MDQGTFDAGVKRLAAASSRRQAVSGLFAAAAVLVGGGVAGARKGGEGKGNAKGKGKEKKGKGNKGKAKGKTRISVCHWDDETGTFQFKTLPQPAWKGHQKHGDVVCAVDPCADAVEACTVTCTAEGVCIAAGSEGEDPAAE